MSNVQTGYAIAVANVTTFQIQSCILKNTVAGEAGKIMNILDSANGRIVDNTIGASNQFLYADAWRSSNLHFLRNTFLAHLQLRQTHHSKIHNNTFAPELTAAHRNGSCVIVLGAGGSNNEVLSNEIDGKSNGIFAARLDDNIGFDDGICLQDEIADRIEDNTIRNHWDLSIENAGSVAQTLIKNNRLINNGIGGIGGWYWSNWRESSFVDNVVENSPALFHFFRAYGLRPDDTGVYFLNNQFIGNRLVSVRSPSNLSSHFSFRDNPSDYESIPLSAINGERRITADKVFVGNNLLMNNDFGTVAQSPALTPGSIFTDGGGNVCTTDDRRGRTDYPIACQ